MILNRLSSLTAAALSVAWFLSPVTTHAAKNYDLNISTEGNAEHCSDLKARSNGELAQSAETFTLQRAEAPVLELKGSDNGVLSIKGWDRAEYSVEACKIAAAETRAAAEQALRSVSVSHSAGRFSSSGPSGNDARWQLFFIVHAPKDGAVDLETKNGPISVSGINGSVKARATNGPISLTDCGGTVEANSANGPISFHGGGGEVHLNAHNGPISLSLAGEIWNGSKLEAHTDNGPVSINVPDTFRSGVRLETSGHSPISCRSAACQGAWTQNGSDQRVMQMNGSQDTIRVTTNNGPVSISNTSKARRII